MLPAWHPRSLGVLVLFGLSLSTIGCAGGGSADAEQATNDRIRREAPGVFSDVTESEINDETRVFADPGDPEGVPMTRTLSIDGSDPRVSQEREPIAPPRSQTEGQADQAGADAGWAILLERISGPQHRARAAERVLTLRRSLGRNDIRVRAVSSGSAVVLGGYANPEDDRAQRDLQYVKSLSAQGARPYAMALLVPPPVDAGTNTRHSLVVAAKDLDESYTHTLQVGVFAGDEQQRKADAENYCAALRREGHEAFFFHGRRVSSVTIGTFTAADFDMDTGFVGPALERLQEQFPHNLYNGGIERDPATGEPWNSALVQIPR